MTCMAAVVMQVDQSHSYILHNLCWQLQNIEAALAQIEAFTHVSSMQAPFSICWPKLSPMSTCPKQNLVL